MSEKSHECSRRRGAEGSDGCSCGNASTQPWPSSVKYLSLTECTPSIAAALTHLASGPAKLHQGASDGQALPSSAFKTEPRFTNTLYGRLDARGAAIRLLRITPGGPTDPLHGSLEVANLDQPPAYDALSYTWADDQGDKSLKETIFLGQQYTPLPITSNCSAALRNLRRRETQVVLWVDSVCINQYADDERSHQVGLMGRIYSLARSVIIYLGEDSYRGKSTGEKVMDRIDYIWHGQLSLTGSYWGQDNLDTDFVDFFSRAYFSRLWIIQEIALAREAWVVCGSWRLNWTLFGSHNLKGLEVRNYIPSWIHHVLGGPRDRDLKQFAELLIATSGCQASDARDKVFGLLGLSREATELALVPDYSRSLREVYMGTAALLLQQGVADLVFTAAAASDRSLEKGIPGWVPLWNNPMTVSQQDLIQHLIPLLHWLYSRPILEGLVPMWLNGRPRNASLSRRGLEGMHLPRHPWDPSEVHLPAHPWDYKLDLHIIAPRHFLLTSQRHDSSEHFRVHHTTGALIIKATAVMVYRGISGSIGLQPDDGEEPSHTSLLVSNRTRRVIMALASTAHWTWGDYVLAVQGSDQLLHVGPPKSNWDRVPVHRFLGPCLAAVVAQKPQAAALGGPYFFASPHLVQLLLDWEATLGYGIGVSHNDPLFGNVKVAVDSFMLSGHPPRWGEAGQTADDGTTQRPDDKSLFDRVVFWRTELLPSLPGHLQNPGRQAELSWGFVQQLNTLEEGFLAIFLARLGDNFPGAPSFTNDLELEMRRGTIHTIITEFRNRSDPDALSFRLGDVATRLMEDAVLKKGLTAQQILHRIADPDPPPMLTSQFVSGGDAARWYKTKNPATLLRRRLEEASRTGGNYSHVRPSLVNDTEYALGELELMCDGMEVQLKFWLKEREVIERVLV